MLLQPFPNILIWYVFIRYILALQLSDCTEQAFAMSAKLHQKLVEDIRLQKRLLGLIDEQNNVAKERRGSYHMREPPPHQGILDAVYYKRSVNLRSGGEDDGDKAYAWDDRRNSSRRRSDVKEASRSRHELVIPFPDETPTSSKPFKTFPDFPICNYSNNNISEYRRGEEKPKVKIAAASSTIGGRYHNANDEGVPRNSMHIHASYNTTSTKVQENHHHHQHRRRSLDLGESNRHYLSDSETVQSNAQARSFLQISLDAQKLGDVFKGKGNVGRDMLKGAMDLEESLRILAMLQKNTGSLKNVERRRQSVDLKESLPFSHRILHEQDSFDGRREPPRLSLDGREVGKSSNHDLRDAIRASLNRQKKLYSKNPDMNHNRPQDSNSGVQQVENKKRIPNVIARLMGLVEMPSDSRNTAPTNRVVGRTDSLIQASRSVEGERGLKPRPHESTPRQSLQSAQTRDSVQKDVYTKAEEYEDTIKAALKRMKQQAPPKQSFQEELSRKLKQLHSVESPQQEPKTLKQILETMQVKGFLQSGPEQSKQKAEHDRIHKEAAIVLKPVMEVHKPARKVQELQEKGTSRKPSNTKESSSPSDIVIIKPVHADSSAVQSPLKATELHPKRTKKGNLVEITESKKNSKSFPKSELGKAAADGQSKKKKSVDNAERTLKRPKKRTDDGDVQKHSKSQQASVLEEHKRRSERISKVKNNKILSKPEKQRPTHSRRAKEGVSRPPRPTHRGSSNVDDKSATKISNGRPINENASINSDMDDNTNEAKSLVGFNRDTMPESRHVESWGPVSQDENSESESSSTSLQHNNSTEESMSPELPATEPDALHYEEADDEIEDEEEDLSSAPIHLKVPYDRHNKFSADAKNDRFAVDMDPSNYVDDKQLTAGEMNYKDYVWQILTRNPTLMKIEAAEPTELYPRLYFKLEEQEAASIPGQEDIKRRHSFDDALERRLVLDCVKELLKRKARLRLHMKQPVRISRIRKAALGFKGRKSIQELVYELSDDIGELMAYHDQNNDRNDFIQSVLKKDLTMGNNSIWNPSWDNGLFGEEEGHDLGRDIEKLIFDDLVEELILQICSVSEYSQGK